MLEPFVAFARLSRLKFLAGGLAGGAFGTAIAAYERGAVDWHAYAAAQATITAFHLMTHYANDYFDRSGDLLALRTPYSGGSGVLVDELLPPVVALRAALVCAALGAGGIAALWLAFGSPVAGFVGAAMGAGAWCYSAPPFRLLARGVGEATTAVVVGMLVPLCAVAAQTGRLDALAVVSTLPGAAAMVAMMLAVEVPDAAADRASGKRNLVVRFGTGGAVRLGCGAAAAVYVAAALAVSAGAPRSYALLEALSLPLAGAYARSLRRAADDPSGRVDAARNEALAGSGVAFFFIVTFFGILGFCALPGRG